MATATTPKNQLASPEEAATGHAPAHNRVSELFEVYGKSAAQQERTEVFPELRKTTCRPVGPGAEGAPA